jgi:hypothetical protein
MRPLRGRRSGYHGRHAGEIDANVALPYRPAHGNALIYVVSEPGMTVSGR